MLRQLLDWAELTQHCLPIEDLTRQSLAVIEDSDPRQFRYGMPGSELNESELSLNY
jgi:fructose-1-phosphate kinase PfkB-like protein